MSDKYPFTSAPSIDEEVMRPLKELLGDNFTELVTDYLTSFPVKFNELKNASECDDSDAMLHISHTLKSSSGSFGFIRLFKRLEHLELQARQNSIVDHIGQIDLIGQEFEYILELTGKT